MTYAFPIEEDGVPLQSPMDALFAGVVYRVAGKDKLETKKAIRQSCEHFIRETGAWKHRFRASPSATRPGWWESAVMAEGIVLRADDIVGADPCVRPGAHMGAPLQSVLGPSRLGSQVTFGVVGSDLRAGDIRFDMTEGRRVVFTTSALQHRHGCCEIGRLCGGRSPLPSSASSEVELKPAPMHPFGDCGIPQEVFLLATMGMRYGSNHFPSWIVERWGDALCDGAAHILATAGSAAAATSWGANYRAEIQRVISAISAGGIFSNGRMSAISPEMEVV